MTRQTPEPPRAARLLLRLALAREAREFVMGDLEEMFARRASRDGLRAARRWYWRTALGSVLRGRAAGAAEVAVPRRWSGSAAFLWDVRTALRALRRAPGFTLIAVLTMALGMGTATAVFAIANQFLLQPLAGAHGAARAAYLDLRAVGEQGYASFDAEQFEQLRAAATGVEGLAGFSYLVLHASTGNARPVGISAQAVIGDFFDVLGVRPAWGRLLTTAESGRASDPALAVISERLWANLFNRDPAAIGSVLRVSGHAVTVIGVAGSGFRGSERAHPVDLWLPISHALVQYGGLLSTALIARLPEGMTREAAEAQLATVTQRLAREFPERLDWLAGFRFTVHPGLRVAPGYAELVRRATWAFAATIVLVLLIACANTANLLLFRNTGREGEVAVRRALGATGGRVAAAHLAESLILAGAGAGVGLLLAFVLAELFRGERFLSAPELSGLTPDARVLYFIAIACITAAVACGALPAWASSRTSPVEGLRSASLRSTRRRSMARTALTSTQIAVSLTLLTGALLLARTVRNIYRIDLGFDLENLHALGIDAGPAGFSEAEAGRVNRDVLRAVRAVQGVESAALDAFWPLQGASLFAIVRPEGGTEDSEVPAQHTYVSPGYFETMGMNVEQGRSFRDDDWSSSGAERVILSRSAARLLFDETDPVGRSIERTDRGTPVPLQVIGVVADARLSSPTASPTARIYRSISASPTAASVVVVRTRGADEGLATRLNQAVASVAPDLPVSELRPFRSLIDARIAERRLLARLLGVLSTLAVGLAAAGLYATMAQGVAQQRVEIGVRMALGAQPAGILRLILGQAGLPVAVGLAAGLLGAFGLAQLIASHLYAVERLEPASYVAAVAAIGAIAVMACVLPGRAAMRIDPASAMRTE